MNLNRYFEELSQITQTADAYIQMIDETIKKKAFQELSAEEKEVLQYSNRILDRRFKTKDVTEMLGISSSGLYKAEREGRIPTTKYRQDASGRNIRDGWTLAQVLEIRKAFNRLPKVPKNHPPMVLSFPNLKGGCWKTTMSLLSAQYYALAGYRVLLIDTDAQGTLSFFMGYRPDIDTNYMNTIAPFLLFDEQLEEQGHDPDSLAYAIKKTHWPNIDLIPGNLSLSLIDTSFPIALAGFSTIDEKQELLERLSAGVLSVASDYDLVIIDGTPSLNVLTISTLMACDHIIVPCPSQMADFASTIQFFTNLKNSVKTFVAAGMEVNFPEYHVLITKFASAKYSNWMSSIIRKTFADRTLQNVVKKTDEVGKAGTQITTIYERQPSKVKNNRSLNTAMTMFNDVFGEIENKIIKPFFDHETKIGATEAMLREEGVL